MIIDVLGYLAQFLFVFASAAQARKSYIDGHSDGISHGLIWMLTVGFSLMMIYVMHKVGFDPVLMLGYIGQTGCILFIAKYKYFPRKHENKIVINGEEINLEGLTQEQVEAAALQSIQNHGTPEELWIWDEGKAQYVNVKDRK